MSDCNTCNWEHLCAYEYKPCDCFNKRKFKEKPEIVTCALCNPYNEQYPICKACNGSGAVIQDESRA